MHKMKMIEELTIEKLREYGFTETFIEHLQSQDKYECFCHNNNGIFWASNVEHKIYSGKEASRKNYLRGDYFAFPYEDLDLIPEYYEFRLSKFIEGQRELIGTIFNENEAKQRFQKNEILITEKAIRENEQYQIMRSYAIRAEKLRHYLIWLNGLNYLPPQQTETKTEQETPKKFTANEYALTYIFDLYANGKQIPTNKTEGGYNKKALIQIGIVLYQFDEKKDTFYRAVKNVAEKFDLNKKQDLINISQSWIEAVKTLSKNWNKTEKYLKEKKLIGE